MLYLNLTEIGANYALEENTSGHRIQGWQRLIDEENLLKQAMVNLDNLLQQRASSSKQATEVFQALKHGKFREAWKVPADAGKLEKDIQKARRIIERQKAFFQVQGFVLDAAGNIDWPNSQALTVKYDHSIPAQDATRVRFHHGRLFWDSAPKSPLDTTNMATFFSRVGQAIYVMSAQGNLHVCTHIIGHRHHSSLLHGGNVAGAGELQTDKNGKLLRISNKSGHYAPSPIHLNQVLHQLEKNGVPMTFEVKEFNGNNYTLYPTATAYLAAVRAGANSPTYELQKLLRYSAHLNNTTLAQFGWHWDSNAGRVYTSRNQPVSHKQVRETLKKAGLTATQDLASGLHR